MTDRDGLFNANNNIVDVFIGIDVGTQGTKAIAYRPASSTLSGSKQTQGKILGRASASYSLLTTDITGRVEQDPNANDWINAVQFVLKTLVTDLGLVAAPSSLSTSKQQHYVLSGIGILGQQHGMVLLDSNYEPLRPAKLWCDVEASEETNWIRTEAASAIDSAGKWDHVLPGFTSPKVLWTIKNEPEIWDQV